MLKVVINHEGVEQRTGVVELMPKQSQERRMVEVNTIGGLYEAFVTNFGGLKDIVIGNQMMQWHERLGQCGIDVLKATFPQKHSIEEKCCLFWFQVQELCTFQVEESSSKLDGRAEFKHYKQYEQVYSELVGPMKVQFLAKLRYFVALLDQSSEYCLVRFLPKKRKAPRAVIEMVRKIEILIIPWVGRLSCINKNNVKYIGLDDGCEYVG